MSDPRPQSSRGRGRGRHAFRDSEMMCNEGLGDKWQHDRWQNDTRDYDRWQDNRKQHDQLSHLQSSAAGNVQNTIKDAKYAGNDEAKATSISRPTRTRPKRPEVQRYVPRGRRLQEEAEIPKNIHIGRKLQEEREKKTIVVSEKDQFSDLSSGMNSKTENWSDNFSLNIESRHDQLENRNNHKEKENERVLTASREIRTSKNRGAIVPKRHIKNNVYIPPNRRHMSNDDLLTVSSENVFELYKDVDFSKTSKNYVDIASNISSGESEIIDSTDLTRNTKSDEKSEVYINEIVYFEADLDMKEFCGESLPNNNDAEEDYVSPCQSSKLSEEGSNTRTCLDKTEDANIDHVQKKVKLDYNKDSQKGANVLENKSLLETVSTICVSELISSNQDLDLPQQIDSTIDSQSLCSKQSDNVNTCNRMSVDTDIVHTVQETNSMNDQDDILTKGEISGVCDSIPKRDELIDIDGEQHKHDTREEEDETGNRKQEMEQTEEEVPAIMNICSVEQEKKLITDSDAVKNYEIEEETKEEKPIMSDDKGGKKKISKKKIKKVKTEKKQSKMKSNDEIERNVSKNIAEKNISKDEGEVDISKDEGEKREDDDDDEDTWDKMFDEEGECLDPSTIEELTKKVGKVKIQKAKIDYLNFKPKDPDLDYDEMGHVIEIYDFPPEFKTEDLLTLFHQYKDKGFDIKWVDDTHALGVFSSAIAAQSALNMVHPLCKVGPLKDSIRASKMKAKRSIEFLQPYKPRPETSAAAARRLVSGALGITSKVPREKRDLERQRLKEAKDKRRLERKQKDDIWEGTCSSQLSEHDNR